MKQLLVLTALLLSLGSARAQAVTKLPGEENLSLRERAERDFLMPVRRKKVVAEAPAKETKTIGEEVTAAPESDGTTTAHYSEATDETARAAEEAAAPAREARASRSYAGRRAVWLARRRAAARAEVRAAERRAELRASARRAAHKGSKAKISKVKTKTKAHAAKTVKSKKITHSKAGKAKASSKKVVHKSAPRKVVSKKTTKKAGSTKRRR